MINLFNSYFISDDKRRQKEIDAVLRANLLNTLINKIYVVVEYPIENDLLTHPKVHKIVIKTRPTFALFFELINLYTKDNEYNIVANSDIYFDDTLKKLAAYNDREALCLTRWEVNGKIISFLNRRDSQDAWIFKGKVRPIIQSEFELGKAGCDNAIADRIARSGYKVINPSKTIKIYHLHTSGIRTYNVNDKVSQPYRLINPHA